MITMLKRAAALSLALCTMSVGLAACSPSTEDATLPTTTAKTTTTVTTTTTMVPAVLDADGLSVRSGPGFDEAIIGGLERDNEMEIVGREGDWYKIHWTGEDGYDFGYVNAHYVDVDGSPNASELQASCPTTVTTTTTTKATKKGETTKKGQTTTTIATTTTTKAGGPTQPPEPTNADGSGVGNKAPSKPSETTTKTEAKTTAKTTVATTKAEKSGSGNIPNTATNDTFN